jgi:hypothetical protein
MAHDREARRGTACVIGNKSQGKHLLASVAGETERVVQVLEAIGYLLCNKKKYLGLSSSEMRAAVNDFIEEAGSTGAAVFYYAGHSFESSRPKDIYLIGQEAADIDSGPTMQSLSLKDVLGELRKLDGLKLVIIDGCRIPPANNIDTWWEAFEHEHKATLEEIPDLFVVTASTSGAPSYDGRFTRLFLKKLGTVTQEDLAAPLDRWLASTMRALAAELRGYQKPQLYCQNFTAEWSVSDAVVRPSERGFNEPVDPPAAGGEAVAREIHVMKNISRLLSRDAAELDHILTYFGSYSQQMGRMMVLQDGDRVRAADFGLVNDDRFILGDFQILTQNHAKKFYRKICEAGPKWEKSPSTGAIDSVVLSFENLVLTVTQIAGDSSLLSISKASDFDYLNTRGAMMRLDDALRKDGYTAIDSFHIEGFRSPEFFSTHNAEGNLYLDALATMEPPALSSLLSSNRFSQNIARTGIGHYLLMREKKVHAADAALFTDHQIDAQGRNLLPEYRFLVSDLVTDACANLAKVRSEFLKIARDTQLAGPLRAGIFNAEKVVIAIYPFASPDKTAFFLLAVSPWAPARPNECFNYAKSRATVAQLLLEVHR